MDKTTSIGLAIIIILAICVGYYGVSKTTKFNNAKDQFDLHYQEHNYPEAKKDLDKMKEIDTTFLTNDAIEQRELAEEKIKFHDTIIKAEEEYDQKKYDIGLELLKKYTNESDAQDLLKKLTYAKAISIFERGNLTEEEGREMIKMFCSIIDYEDSEKYISLYYDKKRNYYIGIDYYMSNQYEEAGRYFYLSLGFLDADKYLLDCKKKLNQNK